MNRFELMLEQGDIERAKEFSERFSDSRELVMAAALTAILIGNSRRTGVVPLTSPATGAKPVTGVELFAKLKPGSDAEKALGAGFLLSVHQGLTEFTSEHLKNALKQAKVGLPENVSQAMITNAKRGLMEELGKKLEGRKCWSLTQTGVQHVDSLLKERCQGIQA
jgi:hypothetical protein